MIFIKENSLPLKTIRAKLGLLNASLYATYGLKFNAIDKSRRYYHLVGSFDTKGAPELPLYQTGEEVYWEKGGDMRYGYSTPQMGTISLDMWASNTIHVSILGYNHF